MLLNQEVTTVLSAAFGWDKIKIFFYIEKYYLTI